MNPKENAAKSQSPQASGSTGAGPRKKKPEKEVDLNALSGSEETPVTMSGGSINVAFEPPFDDESTPGKKVKKAKHTGMRFTRVVIRRGVGGPILNEYPPPGLELGKGCIIEVKGQVG
ncbi:MAG TPA: hypothetical protein VIW80_21390 [Pyrinomonadaceae bacterium]|jgi:hypothetical protein